MDLFNYHKHVALKLFKTKILVLKWVHVEEIEDLLNGFMWSIHEIMISVGDRETNPNQIIRWEIVTNEREMSMFGTLESVFSSTFC